MQRAERSRSSGIPRARRRPSGARSDPRRAARGCTEGCGMTTRRRDTKKERAVERRPLRAIAYLRVSTTGQAEKGMGLAAQREVVRRFAKEQGLELLQIVEEAASGAAKEGELFS